MFIDASVCGEEEGVTTMEQEDVHAWMETLAERETLSPEHIMKYMDWGPTPISKKEEDVAEFLSTVTSGVAMGIVMGIVMLSILLCKFLACRRRALPPLQAME